MSIFTAPSRAGTVVMLFILAALTLLVLLFTSEVDAEPPRGESSATSDVRAFQRNVVEAHIKRFLLGWYKQGQGRRWDEAPTMAAWIVNAAHEAQIDPYVLAVLIQFESSYRVRPGTGLKCALPESVGERGLGQLHGLAARHAKRQGCNLGTPQGQLCGAAHWWRVALERCGGDELKALRAYQTGDCRVVTAGSGRRFAALNRIRRLAGDFQLLRRAVDAIPAAITAAAAAPQ